MKAGGLNTAKEGSGSKGQGSAAKGAGDRGQETQARSASEGPGSGTALKSETAKPNGNGHANGSNGNGHSHAAAKNVEAKKLDTDVLDRPTGKLHDTGFSPAVRSDQFARFQLDAPSCDNCGAITVRNGNCYLCHNCGNSMGCS
jgi:ribonucleoside-diphosphate reductase alpha chain